MISLLKKYPSYRKDIELDSYLGIPYADRQSSVYGCDCLGFIGLVDSRFNDVELYTGTFKQNAKWLESKGMVESTDGWLSVIRVNKREYHLGVFKDGYIYHASITKGQVIKTDSEVYAGKFKLYGDAE